MLNCSVKSGDKDLNDDKNKIDGTNLRSKSCSDNNYNDNEIYSDKGEGDKSEIDTKSKNKSTESIINISGLFYPIGNTRTDLVKKSKTPGNKNLLGEDGYMGTQTNYHFQYQRFIH